MEHPQNLRRMPIPRQHLLTNHQILHRHPPIRSEDPGPVGESFPAVVGAGDHREAVDLDLGFMDGLEILDVYANSHDGSLYSEMNPAAASTSSSASVAVARLLTPPARIATSTLEASSS